MNLRKVALMGCVAVAGLWSLSPSVNADPIALKATQYVDGSQVGNVMDTWKDGEMWKGFGERYISEDKLEDTGKKTLRSKKRTLRGKKFLKGKKRISLRGKSKKGMSWRERKLLRTQAWKEKALKSQQLKVEKVAKRLGVDSDLVAAYNEKLSKRYTLPGEMERFMKSDAYRTNLAFDQIAKTSKEPGYDISNGKVQDVMKKNDLVAMVSDSGDIFYANRAFADSHKNRILFSKEDLEKKN